MLVTLTPHPETLSAAALKRVAVEIGAIHRRQVSLRFIVSGGIDDLIVPAPAEPARTDGLWRYTCFEAFAREGRGLGYHEFNFSPSGQWAAYWFDAHRAGMHAVDVEIPQIESLPSADRYELQAHFVVPGEGSWRLALSAVLETANGEKSYWALSHPPGAPDFHRPGFALAFAE